MEYLFVKKVDNNESISLLSKGESPPSNKDISERKRLGLFALIIFIVVSCIIMAIALGGSTEDESLEVLDTYLHRYELGEEFICADGTPFVYYISRPESDSENYNSFIIEVEAAARLCNDNDSCDDQCEDYECYYLTTRLDECIVRQEEGGIMCAKQEKNAEFYDWSKIMLHTCNGDSWLGMMTLITLVTLITRRHMFIHKYIV